MLVYFVLCSLFIQVRPAFMYNAFTMSATGISYLLEICEVLLRNRDV